MSCVVPGDWRVICGAKLLPNLSGITNLAEGLGDVKLSRNAQTLAAAELSGQGINLICGFYVSWPKHNDYGINQSKWVLRPLKVMSFLHVHLGELAGYLGSYAVNTLDFTGAMSVWSTAQRTGEKRLSCRVLWGSLLINGCALPGRAYMLCHLDFARGIVPTTDYR